jgi:methionyl aminopeptidase
MNIQIKTKEEISVMRHNCQELARIAKTLKNMSKPGISTFQLEEVAQKMMADFGAKPSFQGFQGYPAALCTSINDEVVHAVPKMNRVLKKGDIVSIDLGLYKNGFHSDMAITFYFPPISKKAHQLIKTTQKALNNAISIVKPGLKIGAIGAIIQKTIEKKGFSVMKDLTGHGIGRDLHEDPCIFNYGSPNQGITLKPGMAIAIEPMASMGSDQIKQGPDGFAFVTKDNSLSAHFEHTLAVMDNGYDILTKI